MNSHAKIAPTNEILSAFCSHHLPNEDIQQLSENPNDYLMAHYNVMPGQNSDLSVVQNTEETNHLILPYYSALDKSGAVALSDEDLDGIVGGEIVYTIGIIGAIIVGSLAVTATGLFVARDQLSDSK